MRLIRPILSKCGVATGSALPAPQLSTNLIHLWLTQYDRCELSTEEAEASIVAEYVVRIAALERGLGQLTMELDLAKKTRLHVVSDDETSSINTGPKPVPSERGAK